MASLDSIFGAHLISEDLRFVNKLVYSDSIRESQGFKTIDLPPRSASIHSLLEDLDLEEKCFSLSKGTKSVRIGLFQNTIMKAPSAPILEQKKALHELAEKVLARAHQCGVQIFCFQELWTMPLAFSTQEKLPWVEFAEDAFNGETTQLLIKLSIQYDMVIVSPILERDSEGFLWNTAVIIDGGGEVLGISRKNHIPNAGRHSETYFYNPSELGVPVFQARIGVSICYDRHHPQNWYMYKLNRAEIVFNPAASIARFGEPLWMVEGRSAAAVHKYYVASINRVGVESFRGDLKAGPFFGSSYVAGPGGQRTRSLSTNKNGLLIADVDLRLCGNETDQLDFEIKEEKHILKQIAQQFRKYNARAED